MPKAPSKKDRATVLINKLNEWVKNGDTPQQAIDKLTMAQYDFLIDYDFDIDHFLYTNEQIAEQKANRQAIMRESVGRSKSPNGYNKIYPQPKIDLYNSIKDFIAKQGAYILPRDKENYRDLDFNLNGTHYKIVLSNPRN